MKKIMKIIFEYTFLGVKALIAFSYILFQTSFIAFGYFIIDLAYSFYKKYTEDKKMDLSDEKQDLILKNTEQQLKEQKDNFEKQAEEQKEYFKNSEETKKSLIVLNKLLSDSEIRQSELLSMTKSQFYQVFVYGSPLSELNTLLNERFNLKLSIPKRKYPEFLKSLGFGRMGRFSGNFIINKKNLKNQKLSNIVNFKKFLMYHFSKIRQQEWDEYLDMLKNENTDAYYLAKEKNINNDNYLYINFLVTESNINITHIGYVDHKHLGLANLKSGDNEDVNNQILLGAEISDKEDLTDLKIKIKKIIDKQDLSLLTQGIEQKYKEIILSNQDIILDNLKIKNILEINSLNIIDIENELKKLKIPKEKQKEISQIIFNKAKEFNEALENLSVNL